MEGWDIASGEGTEKKGDYREIGRVVKMKKIKEKKRKNKKGRRTESNKFIVNMS